MSTFYPRLGRALRASLSFALACATLAPADAYAVAPGAQLRTQQVGVGLSSAHQPVAEHPYVTYFDATGTGAGLDRLPWKYVTHVNIAFAGIGKDGTCAWMQSSGNDKPDTSGNIPALIEKLKAARDQNNPKVKLVLSVGGWTMSYRFGSATHTQANAQKLAQSCVDMMRDLNLDGLDYDWEYPTKLGRGNCPEGQGACQNENDPQQFTNLLQATRTALGDGDDAPVLSAAVYMWPGQSGIPYDVAGMDQHLTYWNIMAYDQAAPNWSPGTGFHAPIRSGQDALDKWVDAGATPSKINLGVPLYGYIWYNTPSAGLNVVAPHNGNNGAQLSTSNLIKRYVTNEGCKEYRDRDGTYYFCASGANAGEWSAIDTPEVLWEKATYIRANGFGGIMSWSSQGDTVYGDMSRTIYQALNPGQ